MSFSNVTLKSGPYNCNGSVTAFSGTFYCLASTHIDVVLTDVNGTDTTLTVTTDYTVSGTFPTSTFTVNTVATYAAGNTITIIRNTPLTQETDFGNSGPFLPAVHETAFDKAMVSIQELSEIVARCVKDSPAASAITDPDTYLAACQAAKTAAEAAAATAQNYATNLFTVDVASITANVAIASDLEAGDTLDGVTLVADMRVLLTGQSSAGEDGIYVVPASGAASRASDYPVATGCSGHVYTITQGTAYGDKQYQCTNSNGSDVVGTNGIDVKEVVTANTADDKHWVRRSGVMAEESLTAFAATILDDANAAAAATTLGIGTPDNSSLENSAGTLRVKAGGITNAMLADPKIKAWAKFNGSGTPAASDSYNLDSIADLGTGEYRLTLTTAVGANACILAATKPSDNETREYGFVNVRQSSTTTIYVTTNSSAGSANDNVIIHVAVFE